MQRIKLERLTESIFETHFPIRVYDLNYGKHVGHDALISLLHEARIRFLASMGYQEFNMAGTGLMVTSLAANYLNQAFYGDELSFKLNIANLSKTSFDIQYQVKQRNTTKEIARAVTTMTCFDYQLQKVTKVPDLFIASLQQLQRA